MGEKDAAHKRPSALFQARPKMKSSVSFSGWSALQSPGHMAHGLYAATPQGTYSRHGVPIMSPSVPSRPLRSSLQNNETSSQYTQNYQKFRTRRHTMGTIYATTPLRSPPVPPNTVGRKSSERTVQFAGATIYEDRTLALEPTVCTLLVEHAEALQHPQTGIQMQERRVVNQTKRVFSGADAIQWLVDHVEGISSVEAAQLAGNHLIESGVIVGVSQPGQNKFLGSPNALYQFAPPREEKRETRPSETESSSKTEAKTQHSTSDETTKSKCLIQ